MLKKVKIYLFSRIERKKVQEFVKNQLRKEYIQPLKLSQTSLVFFVPKKNGKKRTVQDYLLWQPLITITNDHTSE